MNKEIKQMVGNKVERNNEQKRMKEVVINVKEKDRGPQSLVVSLQTDNDTLGKQITAGQLMNHNGMTMHLVTVHSL